MARYRVSTFRYGTARKPGEGLRIGTTRYAPRGVPKAKRKKVGKFDLWFPNVAPSAKLLGGTRRNFGQRYRRELSATAEKRALIELLASVARRTPISVGCYCEDERFCHRTQLAKVIEAEAKKKRR